MAQTGGRALSSCCRGSSAWCGGVGGGGGAGGGGGTGGGGAGNGSCGAMLVASVGEICTVVLTGGAAEEYTRGGGAGAGGGSGDGQYGGDVGAPGGGSVRHNSQPAWGSVGGSVDRFYLSRDGEEMGLKEVGPGRGQQLELGENCWANGLIPLLARNLQ